MTPLVYAYLASGLSAALSLALSRRFPLHRPIAALLCAGLACDAVVRLCGPSPSGLRFAVALVAGQVYPWAAVGAVALALHVRSGPSHPGGVGTQPATRPAPGVRKDRGGFGNGARGVDEGTGNEVGGDDAEQEHGMRARGLGRVGAPGGAIFALFTLYASLLLSSGLRGPALARVYAGEQAVVAVALVGAVGRWERRRRGRRGGAHPRPEDSRPSALAVRSRVLCPAPDSGRYPRIRSELPGEPQRYAPRPPTATEICAIVCAAAEVANAPAYLLLPYWTSARAVYATGYVLLCIVQTEALCRRSSRAT